MGEGHKFLSDSLQEYTTFLSMSATPKAAHPLSQPRALLFTDSRTGSFQDDHHQDAFHLSFGEEPWSQTRVGRPEIMVIEPSLS